MNLTGLNSLFRLLVFLLPFLLVQRLFILELQQLLSIVFRKPRIRVTILAVLLFPGILLHEGSHFLSAKLLGVKTGKISLVPSLQSNERIRLGYVETQKVDFFRNSIIGAAPLFIGCGVIAILGIFLFNFPDQVKINSFSDLRVMFSPLTNQFQQPLFWLGLYMIFSISSMMMPSPSDRRDWWIFLLFIVFLGLMVFLIGIWEVIGEGLLDWLGSILDVIAIVFLFSFAAHILFFVPTWVIRILLSKIRR